MKNQKIVPRFTVVHLKVIFYQHSVLYIQTSYCPHIPHTTTLYGVLWEKLYFVVCCKIFDPLAQLLQ